MNRRLLGAAAVVGSALFVVSLYLQASVPVPDSHQFDPALTSPQGLRDVVAPALTLLGLAGHLAGLGGAWRRDRGTFGTLHDVGAAATGGGLLLAMLGYGGVFATGSGTDLAAVLGAAVFALVALLSVVVVGVGVLVLGVATARGPRRADLAVGALLAVAPLAGVAASLVSLGEWAPMANAPYAVAFAALGADLAWSPER